MSLPVVSYAEDTCGLEIIDNDIHYDNLSSGATSTEKQASISNPGTVTGTLSVSATDWVDDASNSVIDVANTRVSLSSGNFESKTPLASVFSAIGEIPPGVNSITYWQVFANLIDMSFTGDLSQTTTLRVSCDETIELLSFQQVANIFYEFDDLTGVTNQATSTNSSPDTDGINNGATTGFRGIRGEAYGFDGTDDYITLCGDCLDFISETGVYTISGWINPDTHDLQNIYDESDRSSQTGANLAFDGTNFYFGVRGNGIWIQYVAVSESLVPIGEWTHFTVTGDGNTSKLYINSELKSTSAPNYASRTPTYDPKIGVTANRLNESFEGKLDDFSIFSSTLTLSEIQQLYNNGNSLDITS